MIVTFFYSLAGGMLAVLATAPVAEIAWKYIRLVGVLTLALSCVATGLAYRDWASAGRFSPATVAFGGAAAAAAMALVITAPLPGRRIVKAVTLLGGAAGLVAGVLSIAEPPRQSQVWITALLIAGQVCGAWLLGSITLAWLLGHAYLTATKMTIAPLRFFSRVLSAAVIARIAFLAAVLLIAWLTEACSPDSLCTRIEQWWLIVLLRVSVGLVAVAVFAYMVSDCVRLRSTQSATGILYFASVMAYVGELASQYLTRELGWPI